MVNFYYRVSDGSIKDSIGDFMQYVNYLKETYVNFDFEKWFDKADFSSQEAYWYIQKILEK